MSIDLSIIRKRLKELKEEGDNKKSEIKAYNAHGRFYKYLTFSEAKKFEDKWWKEEMKRIDNLSKEEYKKEFGEE